MPYPGTIGMEKEKPYRCEVCGKRYKNLNGLKYHRQHSLPCNPDNKSAAVPGISAIPPGGGLGSIGGLPLPQNLGLGGGIASGDSSGAMF
jgi:transcription factor SFP1